MTLTEHTAAAAPLRSTAWLVRRFTAAGVTATLSRDLRICLSFDAGQGVMLSAGMLSGAGRISWAGTGIDFALQPERGADATPPASLERRIFDAFAGSFEVRRDGSQLHLRQGGTSMDLVAVAD